MSETDPLSSDLIPAALRDALRLSPQNGPLLEHVAESVLKVGGFAEAEALFKQALALTSGSLTAKLGLASAFFNQGKSSAALVIVETLTSPADAPVRALLLHARLCLRAAEPRLAARLYTRAVTADPSATDSALEEELIGYLPKPASPSPKPRPPTLHPSATPPPAESHDGEEWKSSAERLPEGNLPGDPAGEIERPEIAFDDVGGMQSVKEEIRMKIILPLQQPDLFKAYGKTAGGGILMYGPPGCGKTFLARATAGEVSSNFIAIGINDVLDMWIGQSEKNLHSLFEQARQNRPCVLFFDEVDALGANRTHMLRSGGRHLINQFLSELDGVTDSNEGVLILAATNTPWHLDAAFRRPGRFDRILFVPPPDLPARSAIVRLMLKGKPAENVDFDGIAKKTDGFSGADLKAVVDLAVEAKLRDAMQTGKIQALVTRDLLDAAKKLRPTTRDWFETARNYALYSNQSGLYDDILDYLKIKR
jgi:transitional endoplasmic reticulum ATPase